MDKWVVRFYVESFTLYRDRCRYLLSPICSVSSPCLVTGHSKLLRGGSRIPRIQDSQESPGFPVPRGRQSCTGGGQHTIMLNLSKKCLKFGNILGRGARGGGGLGAPRSANGLKHQFYLFCLSFHGFCY